MKYKFGEDERYPDYGLDSGRNSVEIELTDDDISFIKEATEKYDEAQELIHKKILEVEKDG